MGTCSGRKKIRLMAEYGPLVFCEGIAYQCLDKPMHLYCVTNWVDIGSAKKGDVPNSPSQ